MIHSPCKTRALPKAWMLLIGVILLWIYGYRISTNPLTWEEPRRCLVALEMIYRGDYVVPYVLGESYRNKPPLQNWLIVLFAGNRADRVGQVPIRLISVLSLVGIALCLWRFAPGQSTTDLAWMPVLIFLTMGIVVQYGRSGELDALFTFWIVAAFGCFETGRRAQSPWRQWCLSQVVLAGGVLTKVLAPVFFYPPILYCVWKDRKNVPFALWPFLLGLITEIVLVSAWLIPYSQRSSAASLGQRWTEELLSRTPLGSSMVQFVAHIAYFPFEIIGTMLPWSLVFGLCLLPQVRRAMLHAVQREPCLRLAAAISLWSLGLLWPMPGAKGRYLFPALAFFAVLVGHTLVCGFAAVQDAGGLLSVRLLGLVKATWVKRRTAWLMLGLCWGLGLCLMTFVTDHEALWQPLVIGLVAIASTGYVVRAKQATWPFCMLFLMALLYGILYAGVSRVIVAETEAQLVQSARTIAASIEESLPVVCDSGASYHACFVISRHLGGPLHRVHPPQGSYLLVTSLLRGAQAHGQLLAQVAPLALWRITRD